MKQTQNYQLSQWEKTDRIKMEDFNSDNQKIDSQLHAAMQQLAQAASQEGLAAEQAAREAADAAQAETLRNEITAAQKWVKLGDATLSEASNIISITIPNAESYACFFIIFDVSGTSEADLSWQGESSTYMLGSTGWNALKRCCGFCLAATLPAGGVMLWYITSYSSTQNSEQFDSYELLSEAATQGSVTISLVATTPDSTTPVLNKGSCFRIFGLKK